VRSSVDLPAPEKPTIPKISPFSTVRLTSRRASTVRPFDLKDLETFSKAMAVLMDSSSRAGCSRE